MTRLTAPFPEPPQQIREMFAILEKVANASKALHHPRAAVRAAAEDVLNEYGDLDLLPRPWDPPTLAPTQRKYLWVWLELVSEWVNTQYAWAARRVIPGCWPEHPHIIHEIAVLACLRYNAGRALTPDAMEEWHRWSLPQFIDRMVGQVGSGCDSEHNDWPARLRVDSFRNHHRDRRVAAYRADSEPEPAPEDEPDPEPSPDPVRHLTPVK